MVGKRRYWRPKSWVYEQLVANVDEATPRVEEIFGRWRMPFRWAEAERVDTDGNDRLQLALYEVRYQRWGFGQRVHRAYIVDITMWVKVDRGLDAAFYQTMSFWRRIEAETHYGRMRNGLAARARAGSVLDAT